MTMFLIQSAILLAIAFTLGCIVGYFLHHLFSIDDVRTPVAAAAATTATAATMPLRPAPVAAMPEPDATPASVMAKPAKPDDLKLIVGIGPVNERKLHALGVTRFAQIAAWTPQDEESYGDKLEFPGRIEREEWVRQARNLAAGGQPEDEAALAKGNGGTKPAARAAGLISATAKSNPANRGAKVRPAAAAKAQTQIKKPMPFKLDRPVGGKPDNLTLINGIGNVIEKKLNEMGVFHFEQIANWTMSQAESFSVAVGFPGRALREGWVKEAAIFAKGGTTEHAKQVEAGQISSSRVSNAAAEGGKKK